LNSEIRGKLESMDNRTNKFTTIDHLKALNAEIEVVKELCKELSDFLSIPPETLQDDISKQNQLRLVISRTCVLKKNLIRLYSK
jgi:hypothetical protein